MGLRSVAAYLHLQFQWVYMKLHLVTALVLTFPFLQIQADSKAGEYCCGTNCPLILEQLAKEYPLTLEQLAKEVTLERLAKEGFSIINDGRTLGAKPGTRQKATKIHNSALTLPDTCDPLETYIIRRSRTY